MNLIHKSYDQDLREFFEYIKRRDSCSQLTAVSDADYRAGLQRLEMEIAQAGNKSISAKSYRCFLTIQADKPY